MGDNQKPNNIGDARKRRREQVVTTALSLEGAIAPYEFDAVHSPLCAVDVVMVSGAPWLKDALEKDYLKDESGYKKIGGGANTPKMAYFFRSATNLMHFLKRQGLYIPRGSKPLPEAGMACFLDWPDRGRFNFAPDRSGIIVSVEQGQIKTIIIPKASPDARYIVSKVNLDNEKELEIALIGYSDLP